MKRAFRMAIPACICVTVAAESEKEALGKATKFRDEMLDGFDLGTDGDSRCYPDSDGAPFVEDESDDEYDPAKETAYGQ